MTMSSFYKQFLVLSALILSLMGIAHSYPTPLKETVKDIAGKTLNLPQPTKKATVLIFLAHDCPISNAYAPEITRITNDYGKRGVSVVIAYAENDFDAAGARRHSREYGYKMPAVLDNKFKLSQSTGATVTPEAVVYSPEGKLLYRGRIDNRFASYGKKRPQPTQRDLRTALDAILAGRPVPHPTTVAVGCFIPEKAN